MRACIIHNWMWLHFFADFCRLIRVSGLDIPSPPCLQTPRVCAMCDVLCASCVVSCLPHAVCAMCGVSCRVRHVVCVMPCAPCVCVLMCAPCRVRHAMCVMPCVPCVSCVRHAMCAVCVMCASCRVCRVQMPGARRAGSVGCGVVWRARWWTWPCGGGRGGAVNSMLTLVIAVNV